MRYPASEKLEIIRTVETSRLPVRKTLDKIGIPWKAVSPNDPGQDRALAPLTQEPYLA